MGRKAALTRRTGETVVELSLALDGSGQGVRESGVGFFDHMLDLLAYHGALDLTVRAEGDLQRGAHHTVEDVGLTLGQALAQALGERTGIVRYGFACVPMDEARAAVALDLSGRPLCAVEGRLPVGTTAGFEHELLEEFFRALASTGKLTLHLKLETGRNAHHLIEASFKALAVALRAAVAPDPARPGVPSTKGTLTG